MARKLIIWVAQVTQTVTQHGRELLGRKRGPCTMMGGNKRWAIWRGGTGQNKGPNQGRHRTKGNKF